MLLLVGLGNPGIKYANNRHNVGHMFVDYILESQKSKIKSQSFDKAQDDPERNRMGQNYNSKVKIMKTDCFMNISGIFVKKLSKIYHLGSRDLIVVHDDLDIPLGKFHIQLAVGPQLHNGLESIEQHLKTKDFYRIRIGIDDRSAKNKVSGETYTLQNFLFQEKKLLETEIFPKIFSQLKLNFKML